jgi:lysophospholipase
MKPEVVDRRRLPESAAMSRRQAPDGWIHRRMDWRQPAGAPVRGSLLFAGGRGDFIEKYVEAYAYWHARGWNVTVFDWRGQGGSRGAIAGGHLDSLDVLVDDLAAMTDAWRGDPPAPHVVVAHSMGGHIVLRALADRGLKIDAAVLVAPMVVVNARPLPARLAAWVAGLLAGIGLARRPAWKTPPALLPPGSRRQHVLTGSAERYADELWWWDREPGYNLGAPSWGWLRAAYRSSAHLTDAALAAIAVPLLFLGTDRDRLVSPAAIRRAAAAVPGAELLMFPDAGHELLREADPVRLAALARIDSFLDAHAPA